MLAARSSLAVSGFEADDADVHQDLTIRGFADDYDIYTNYLRSLRAHLRDTTAHLAGSILPHDSTSNSTFAPKTLQDDTLSPPRQIEWAHQSEPILWYSSLSSWSQSEVDAFFHAVSIYSRWRPDLIADAVKTKGEVEVVEFLVNLDSCARSRATDTDQDIHKVVSTPAAIEVSDNWVAAEEAMAVAIAVEEVHGELEELETLRRKRVRDASANLIPRGKRRRVTVEAGKGSDDDQDAIEVSEGEALFKKWHAHKIAAWRRDDLLKKLDYVHLQVLDAILREEEDTEKEKSLIRKPAGTSDPGMDLKVLSPTSRRRLTKRLYMRRKRAQLRGEDVSQAGDTPARFVRMKPGRHASGKGKGKSAAVVEEIKETSEFTEPNLEAKDDDLKDEDEADIKKRSNVVGKTRYQKIRAEFDNAGIDACYLHKHGMDLFHHGPLGKLVGLYKLLEQCSEDEINASYISAELTGYLQALVVAFTTDVIRRAIMRKEETNELKGQKKVWRGALRDINQAAVDHALETIGARTTNRHEHFSNLIDRYHLSPRKWIPKLQSNLTVDAEGEQAIAAEHSPDSQSKKCETELSPHRAIYTPAFLAPTAFNISVVGTFFTGYDSCFLSNARTKEEEETEDSLLSDETDEEALEDELQEDEIMDQDDVEIGKELEEQLWADVEREEGDDDANEYPYSEY